MPKPVMGNQLVQDTFEGLKDQTADVVQGAQDIAINTDQNSGDSGIEQLGGTKQDDPQKVIQQAQKQGLTDQQLAEKRKKERKDYKFFQEKVEEFKSDHERLVQEEQEKKKKEEEEEEQKKHQKIVQLQEEQSRTAALAGPAKPKQGRGTAFLPVQAKQNMGTGELSKTITN